MSEIAEDEAQASPELMSWLPTLVVFGFITLVFYLFFFKPIFAGPPQRQQQQTEGAREPNGNNLAGNSATTAQFHRRSSRPTAASTSVDDDFDDMSAMLASLRTRQPPHCAVQQCTPNNGLISFRSTTAILFESSKEQQQQNRKDRARLLSRILTLQPSAQPPPRGTTVVVTLPRSDVTCPKLPRMLVLMATYFNLLVVIDVGTENSDDAANSKIVESLSRNVPTQVLPAHRILVSQSLTGRIAICRQLGTVQFVLDFDPQMKTELGRFGFSVMIYGQSNTKRKDEWSLLASSLLYDQE